MLIMSSHVKTAGTQTGAFSQVPTAKEVSFHSTRNGRISFISGKKIALTKEEKISSLEEQIKALQAKSFTTTNSGYGTKDYRTLELFDNTSNNIIKAADLMPCPRRPPKK